MDFNEITVVIVTYGNRWQFVQGVIAALEPIKEISQVILFNNGGGSTTQKSVEALIVPFKIVYLETANNLGSAGGYRKAIEKAAELTEGYILLLDDDTMIEPTAFKEVQKIEALLPKNQEVCYTLNRTSWTNGAQNFSLDYYKNSFFQKSFLKLFFKRKYLVSETIKGAIVRNYTTYSGFLFKSSYLERVDLPFEDYYLYVDDTDFTYRFTQEGILIYEVTKAKMSDLEESWGNKSEKPVLQQIFELDNPYRGLINLRNRVYFENKYLKTNNLLYTINEWIYLQLIKLKFMPKNSFGRKRYQQMRQMIKDGKQGRLGAKLSINEKMTITYSGKEDSFEE